MSLRGRLLRLAVLFAALGFLLPVARVRAGGEVTLSVIVGSGSKLTSLSMADLHRAYLSERVSDPDGNKLIPLNHPPKTVDRVGFDRVVLDMSPEEVGRFWVDRRIRGGNGPPRTVDSIQTLRRVVQNLPGAMAYVRPNQLTGDVKAVRIEGKLPGDAGYPIHFKD